MAYAALMVHVDDSATAADRVRLAATMADQLGALLIGVGASMPQPMVGDPMGVAAMAGELMTLEFELADADVRQARSLFRTTAQGLCCAQEWRSAIATGDRTMADEARCADLIIVGPRVASGRANQTLDAAEVMMTAGRPVLFVPQSVDASPVGAPALIAWTNTREARRALGDALPLLARAGRVRVLCVHEPDEASDAQTGVGDVVAYLARHRIQAEAMLRPRGKVDPAQLILAVAAAMEAKLVVLGGYGHARLQEWAFGGVTRDMIATSPVCLLMSH